MELTQSKLWRLFVDQSTQVFVFIGLSILVLILTFVADRFYGAPFQKYFGRINPLLLVFVLAIIGLILFSFLLIDSRFAIYRQGNLRGILVAIGLAMPFAIVMILVDRMDPFPADMNVALPGGLFFYPAIGFVVELLFHLLPFCLVYFSLAAFFRDWGDERIIWISIMFTALLEPVFQVVFTTGMNTNGVVAYVGFHLLLTNLVQLLLFRRYDFISMYAFRLSYYFLWHIIWGYMRLDLLF